jgi:drug/metabolite transporter (DMT)-like permease
MLALGLLAALLSTVLFNVGVALQALEARSQPKSLGLRLGLLGRLLRRPLWLLGVVLGVVGIAPQVLALAWAPFAVVQTALTAGLILLLAIAVRHLGERVTREAIAGVVLIIAGVALVSWGAPGHSEAHRTGWLVIAVVGVTSLVSLVPFAARDRFGGGHMNTFAGGVGFAVANIATKLMSDDVGRAHCRNAIAWGAVVVVAGTVATLVLMTAFQQRKATFVVPVSTAVQTFLPIVLAPLFLRESFGTAADVAASATGILLASAGVVIMGRTKAVSELASGGQS